ncbi:MAG: pyridine nucleotide-disulfide oxidoreductase, partial [Spirochaetales bacterium]|nr:pyridine nucleotide-disulfide oxidoreductase [Spirochaetales bacterium]
ILQKEKVGFIYIYSATNAPSMELLPMMQEIEKEFITDVKLNILDVYKGKSLCDRLSCDVEPMTIFYTKDGEVLEQSTMCDRPHIIEKLKSLL